MTLDVLDAHNQTQTVNTLPPPGPAASTASLPVVVAADSPAVTSLLPYTNAVAITPGSPVTAGRGVFIASTAVGSVRLKLSGGTTLDVPVVATGATMIDKLAVVDVVAANTTGTHVVSVLN